MKYDNAALNCHCLENSIELIKDYNNVKINREHYIEGKCKNYITCGNNFK